MGGCVIRGTRNTVIVHPRKISTVEGDVYGDIKLSSNFCGNDFEASKGAGKPNKIAQTENVA